MAKKEVYADAREQYAELGIDTEKAMDALLKIPVSMHCWQGDDVGGFEHPGATLDGGGIQVTRNYPGKARSIPELMADIEKGAFARARLIQAQPPRELRRFFGDESRGPQPA